MYLKLVYILPVFNWVIATLQCCSRFLLYNKVNPLYVYPLSIPTGPPSHLPPSHPSRLSQGTEMSSLCAIQQVPLSNILHMLSYVIPFSQLIPSYSVSTCQVSLCRLLLSYRMKQVIKRKISYINARMRSLEKRYR